MRWRWLFGSVVALSACAQVSGLDEYAIENPISGSDAGDAGEAGAVIVLQDSGHEGGALSDVIDGIDARPDADADAGADATTVVDAAPDADAGPVVDKPFAFVQSASADLLAQNIPATLASGTTAGNLVVVAVAQNGNRFVTVTSVTDDAPGGSSTYVSANQRALDVGCASGPDEGNTIEIWYTKHANAGAKTVTVAMGSSHRVQTWVLEASGANPTAPLDNGGVVNSQPVSKTFFAPKVATSTANALVVSTEVTCNAAESVRTPFTSLPFLLGNDTAYFITSNTGTYGAVWNANQGSYAASTVVFK